MKDLYDTESNSIENKQINPSYFNIKRIINSEIGIMGVGTITSAAFIITAHYIDSSTEFLRYLKYSLYVGGAWSFLFPMTCVIGMNWDKITKYFFDRITNTKDRDLENRI